MPVGSHVGRGRRQPARRASRSPASWCGAGGGSSTTSATASSPATASCGSPTSSATPATCPSSWPRPGASSSSPRSCRGTRPTGSRTTRSGGRASTARGSSPTSRRPTPTTARSSPSSWPTPCATCKDKGAVDALDVPVRPRRRRRRADPRDARAGPSHRRPGRPRHRRAAAPRHRVAGRRSSRPPGPSTPTRRCGGASCTSRCTAAPTPPRPGPSGATAGASWRCASSSCGRHRGAPTGADAPLADLERLWKVLLLHQFHDIIPGSSIALGARRHRGRPRRAARRGRRPSSPSTHGFRAPSAARGVLG